MNLMILAIWINLINLISVNLAEAEKETTTTTTATIENHAVVVQEYNDNGIASAVVNLLDYSTRMRPENDIKSMNSKAEVRQKNTTIIDSSQLSFKQRRRKKTAAALKRRRRIRKKKLTEFINSSHSNDKNAAETAAAAAAASVAGAAASITASVEPSLALALLENANQKSIMGLADNIDNNNILSYPAEVTRNRTFNGGDLSCLKNGFRPAPHVPNAEIKYIRNDLFGVENAFIEAEYICHRGYRLTWSLGKSSSSTPSSNIRCKNNRWFGKRPTCKPIKRRKFMTCQNSRKCQQICTAKNGIEQCSCYKGFRKRGNRCVDINECKENGTICELKCFNTMGSYRCKCPHGFKVGDEGNCIDINECLLGNGHGPCQDTCINNWGGYNCTCNGLPGTKLSDDRHSCEDVDECSVNNGGCSHTCLNTLGRAFCLCPIGWTLDTDWKTCIDIDECSDPELSKKCEYSCENTPGSYKCVNDFEADQPMIENIYPGCSEGFEYNRTLEDCIDIDECERNISGCSEVCTNTIGSYHCSCKAGNMFAADNFTCIASDTTTDVACPPLFPSRHGYLECSRPTKSGIGRKRITNRPGSQCVLRCPTGFKEVGQFSKICTASGVWIGDGDGACIRYPQPKLLCPPDILTEIAPNSTTARIRIQRPKTDVSDRDILIEPIWAKTLDFDMTLGKRNITFTVKHPLSKLTASCTVSIKVLAGEPPSVKFCPETQRHNLDMDDYSIDAFWTEPIFTDNINVTKVTRTNNPGSAFGIGSHQIIYNAYDAAGYNSKCVFKIIVNLPMIKKFYHQLPMYNFRSFM